MKVSFIEVRAMVLDMKEGDYKIVFIDEKEIYAYRGFVDRIRVYGYKVCFKKLYDNKYYLEVVKVGDVESLSKHTESYINRVTKEGSAD